MSDENLNEIVKEYSELAKDKNIDVASLMVSALQQQDQNRLSSKTKRWAYLISIGLPPVGLLFAAWFYFRSESDAKTAAYICVALTAVSIILTLIFFNIILSGTGSSVEQIQQIKPQDVLELTQ